MTDAISRSALLEIFSDKNSKHCEFWHYGIIQAHIKTAPALSLNTLRDAIYEDAVAHGLWDDMDDYIGAQVHVVVEEVKELIDAAADLSAAKYRGEDLEQYKQNFIEELADVVISSLSLAGKQEVDIDAAVRGKMEINKGRSFRHEEEK